MQGWTSDTPADKTILTAESKQRTQPWIRTERDEVKTGSGTELGQGSTSKEQHQHTNAPTITNCRVLHCCLHPEQVYSHISIYSCLKTRTSTHSTTPYSVLHRKVGKTCPYDKIHPRTAPALKAAAESKIGPNKLASAYTCCSI